MIVKRRLAKRSPAIVVPRAVWWWQRGCVTAMIAAMLQFLAPSAAAAEFAYYPGAWYDAAQTRAQGAFSQERGVSGLTIYATNDRWDRVDAFYRQFLYPIPSTGAGRSVFCLDPDPERCTRFVELQDLSAGAGVGTRIIVFDRR